VSHPAFNGVMLHRRVRVGIKKLIQFVPLEPGFCKARPFSDESKPMNAWIVMDLVKDNPKKICPACSDASVRVVLC